jgi:iron complex outermembrane receptor protein
MMRFSKNDFLHTTAALTLAIAIHGNAAFAQTSAPAPSGPAATADDQDDETVDREGDIIVTGIRGSINQSIDDKRRSGQIVDTINAEDIGKSTDQNIAEALNRISGVSVNTVDGQGATISVRGANADQTVVTLNGVALGSTGFSQGVDLSAYSADILAKVEVVKTPSADDEEGSLSAVVNLITRKPLDLKRDVRTISLQQRYNGLSKSFDHKISGTISQRFFEDRFGVIVTAYDEKTSVRRDQVAFSNYNAFGTNFYTDQNGKAFGAADAIAAEATRAAMFNRPSAFAGVEGVAAGRGPYANIAYGLAPTTAGYEIYENEYSRRGADASMQWRFSDRTSLTLNGTYNQQKFRGQMTGVSVSQSNFGGHIDGVQQPNLGLTPNFLDRTSVYDTNTVPYGGTVQNPGDPVTNPGLNNGLMWTDPVQNWRLLDTDTRTYSQYLNRFSTGSTTNSVNNYTVENYLFSAEFEHGFTDRLRMSAGASLAKSEQKPERSIYMVANRNRVVGPWNLHHVPADYLQPAGYDCSGSACRLVGGTSTPNLGQIIDIRADQNDLWDNVGRTGFNPDDLNSHTLSYIQSSVTRVSDEQRAAFADFDWDVDFAGINSFEFGAKYTERKKFVDAQSGTPRASSQLVEAISPFTGQTIFVDPAAISLISAGIFSSGTTSANNLLSGLGVQRDHISDGWATFDPVAALQAVTTGERDFTLDRTQTRGAEFRNIAAYIKANFAYFEDRLKGDIGLRYVRTKLDTTGFAGANFAFDAQGQGRIIDPIALNTLRNSNQANRCPVLSETPSPLGRGPSSAFWTGAGPVPTDFNDGRNYNLTNFQARNRQARIDGQGTSPAVPGGVCYDPLLEPGAIPATFLERNLIRYSDLSTEQFGTIGGRTLSDRSRASIAAADAYDYNVFLPSLNLSFLATDKLIARFSAYRTMSRPPIDDLRAGFRMSEGSVFEGTTQFRPTSTVDLYSAQLNPLKANNIDIAVEWYFKRDAMLSANLFYKDISDLVETVDQRWFIGDLRRIAADPNGATVDGLNFTDSTGRTTDLLLTPSSDVSAVPDVSQCMPRRLQGEAVLQQSTSWLYGGDGRALCNEYNVTRRQNSESARVMGAEVQYVQSFTFLPGLLSGLGIAANYTFSKSEFQDSKFPIPGTPRHSYNVTGYWQKAGHQLRLAYAGSSDSLVQRSFSGGALWQEGRRTLDFSAAYQVTPKFSFTFDAANITDAPVRTYFTSRIIRLPDATGAMVNFDEGSIYEGAPKSRTVQEYNTGRIFRFGVRAEF